MFALVMPFGAVADVKKKRPPSPLVPMCEITGGKVCTCVTVSGRHLIVAVHIHSAVSHSATLEARVADCRDYRHTASTG
jgi:hypothetical protein